MFDTNEFVESVIAKGRSLDDIVNEAREEISRAESSSRLVIDGPDNRAEGSSDHVRFLRALVFFLQSGDMPNNSSSDDFQLLLPLAQHLVDRGDLEPDILELLEE